ncbi:unnamed protein product [Symbiodinium sp. CCMP2456]|nr:unnamed protein product [Symbiodinium sp. CCMP2456]
MAFGSKFDKKEKKGDDRPKTGKRVTAVKEWNLATKALMRAFPDESGCMIKTGGKSVKKALAPQNLREKLDPDSSELIRRPGMGLNLAAASMSAGLEVLNLGEDMAPQLGLQTLLDFVGKHGDLEELLKKAQKDYKHDKSNLAEDIGKLFRILAGPEDNSDDFGKALAKLADGASRLFAFAIAACEVRAMINKQKAWSKTVPDLEKQSPGVRRWVAEPSDESLCEGLAQSLRSLFYWGGSKEKRRFGADDADSDGSSGGNKKPPFGGNFLEKMKSARKKISSSSSKTSGKAKKRHGKSRKTRKSVSSSSSRAGFGVLTKKKPEASVAHTEKEQETYGKINSALKEHFQEVDEGQLLVVEDVQFKNCCLPLAVARSLEGLEGTRTAVHKRAALWMEALPEHLKNAVAKNEAKPGQMLFDDYLAKVVEDDESMIACLVIPGENITRVWAGATATLATSRMIILKYAPCHFTSLLPKHGDPPAELLLKGLPPVQVFSFIGSTELKESMCNAQKGS